ncbi:MAG: FAD-dependent oxidoreductase [Elusimicrobia bacterium]|nr:FAD-dependent oxidoreductase [Elusimicrobiota bacterium]
MYDLIIVGAGPAGITASVYAARKRMSFVIITRDVGGQTLLSADIENYTGYQFITGTELAMKFKQHFEQFKVELKEGESVAGLEKEGDIIKIRTEAGEEYASKTAIISSGRIPRKLGAKGEAEFKNRGVTYCATCDGPLFSNMSVAVIGGGNSALDAALQLMKIASSVCIIDSAPRLGADPVMVEKASGSDKVTVYTGATVREIYGDKFVEGIRFGTGGGEKDIPVRGVFIEIGSVPSSGFVKGVTKNESGEITVNCKCETNVRGIFAAGDVTDVTAKQIIVACGEGAKASIAAFEYLSKNK